MSSRKKVETITIRVGDHYITSAQHLKYLGVLLDHRLNFRDHLEYASEKARKVYSSLSRLMPNIGGPKQPIRELLASVIKSTLTYASPIWADSTNVKSYIKGVRSVHRLTTIRIICAFRTISDEAANVIARRCPVDIEVKKAKAIYVKKHAQGEEDTREPDNEESLAEWQHRWSQSTKGRWTYKLIPEIKPWLERNHGEVNYHLSQFLSGHGCFREYLHKYKHVEDQYCLYCDNKIENAEHILLECKRFDEKRRRMEDIIKQPVNPAAIVQYMLTSKEAWEAMSGILVDIMKLVRRDERAAYLLRSQL